MIVAKDPTSIESRVKELLSDAGEVKKESKAYYDTAVTPTVTSKPEKAYDYSLPVPATEAKDSSWFKDAAFVGDSRMEGIMNYADFEHSLELLACRPERRGRFHQAIYQNRVRHRYRCRRAAQ